MVKNAFKLLHVAFFFRFSLFQGTNGKISIVIFLKKETVSLKADRSSIKLKIALSK